MTCCNNGATSAGLIGALELLRSVTKLETRYDSRDINRAVSSKPSDGVKRYRSYSLMITPVDRNMQVANERGQRWQWQPNVFGCPREVVLEFIDKYVAEQVIAKRDCYRVVLKVRNSDGEYKILLDKEFDDPSTIAARVRTHLLYDAAVVQREIERLEKQLANAKKKLLLAQQTISNFDKAMVKQGYKPPVQHGEQHFNTHKRYLQFLDAQEVPAPPLGYQVHIFVNSSGLQTLSLCGTSQAQCEGAALWSFSIEICEFATDVAFRQAESWDGLPTKAFFCQAPTRDYALAMLNKAYDMIRTGTIKLA